MEDYIRRVFEGEAPCDKCSQAYKCEIEELACRAFSFYVRKGTFSMDTPRNPTNHLFNLIFRDDDVGLKSYFKNALGGQCDLL
jgi:hypothetical protein